MRSFIFLLSFCLFSASLFADNRVTPTISEVTVYRSGAKVSSVATVKVAAGNSEVIFENLSPCIHAGSIQPENAGHCSGKPARAGAARLARQVWTNRFNWCTKPTSTTAPVSTGKE